MVLLLLVDKTVILLYNIIVNNNGVEELTLFMYNPIGKTLQEVHEACGADLNGYCVFILQHKDDTIGIHVGEDITVMGCIEDEPEYKEYIVKLENNFFGQTVLRAIRKDMYHDNMDEE